MKAASVADRVAAGVKFLDKNHPAWVHEVDPEVLDLMLPRNCVLGQIVKQYDPRADYFNLAGYSFEDEDDLRIKKVGAPRGTKRLVMSKRKAIELGFHVITNPNGELTEDSADWDRLTRAWKKIIKARRKATR